MRRGCRQPWRCLMATRYDRKAEDLDNIVMLEHVTLQIPDQVI